MESSERMNLRSFKEKDRLALMLKYNVYQFETLKQE